VSRTGAALEVLGQAAFGPNSALYRKLVLEERRVQSLVPSFELARDPYLVGVQALVSNPEDVATVQAEIMETIDALHTRLVSPKQLADARSHIKYGFLMSMEAALDVAFVVTPTIVNTGRLEPIEDYFRTLEAVTAEDLRDAARRYLVEAGRTTITMVQEN
jgi:zinc protease